MTPDTMKASDFSVENHGSIILIRPLNNEVQDWLGDNVSEDSMYFGDALVVEPRYAGALIEGLMDAGFSCLK